MNKNNSMEMKSLEKIMKNRITKVPPSVMALVVGFIIIVLATIFPEIKQTIIDIATVLK